MWTELRQKILGEDEISKILFNKTMQGIRKKTTYEKSGYKKISVDLIYQKYYYNLPRKKQKRHQYALDCKFSFNNF